MLGRREEALREERQVGRRSSSPEVVYRPREALVDEDRAGGGAGGCEPRSEICRVGVRTKVARRRRTPLHLGDRLQAGSGEGVAKAPHQAGTSFACDREKETSASSRSAAAPEPTASRA